MWHWEFREVVSAAEPLLLEMDVYIDIFPGWLLFGRLLLGWLLFGMMAVLGTLTAVLALTGQFN